MSSFVDMVLDSDSVPDGRRQVRSLEPHQAKAYAPRPD
jgi:hypothetical protein